MDVSYGGSDSYYCGGGSFALTDDEQSNPTAGSSCTPTSAAGVTTVISNSGASSSAGNSAKQRHQQHRHAGVGVAGTSNDNDFYGRPIVVGYAFGPKKMSTMGVVMAEASKTQIRQGGLEEEEVEDEGDNTQEVGQHADDDLGSAAAGSLLDTTGNDIADETYNTPTKNLDSHRRKQNQKSIVITIDGYGSDVNALSAVETIVRNFRDASSETGTCTASTITQQSADNCSRTSLGGVSASGGAQHQSSSFSQHSWHTTVSGGGRARSGQPPQNQQQQPPIRVSFVPLDLDQPLEEQHGGKTDIILHKLTEDILCLSQLEMQYPDISNQLKHCPNVEQVYERIGAPIDSPSSCASSPVAPPVTLLPEEKNAISRVHRLCRYTSAALIVDDPICVETLMSRSEIASTLHRCLTGVATSSGMPVATPASAVLRRGVNGSGDLKYPLIVKPLMAAGTKASHKMAIVLNRSGLEKFLTDKFQLCQEYTNHNALLYKVYVLGDDVRVFKRRSLPNLPPPDRPACIDFLEFDSQRPYPRLSEFGFEQPPSSSHGDGKKFDSSDACIEKNDSDCGDHITAKGGNTLSSGRKRPRPSTNDGTSVGSTAAIPKQHVAVTPEEVRPVVNALKSAFGLELFGFDVLISNESPDPRMLVVDVNYFPSYKEVANFPSLLANYLTDRVIRARIAQQQRKQVAISTAATSEGSEPVT